MGTSGYTQNKRSCIQSQRKSNIMTDKESKKIFDSLPIDQYLCPFCGEIP